MALHGYAIVLPGATESGINQDYEWGGKRTLRAYFDPADDENYVRNHLGAAYVMYCPHPSDARQIITDIRVKDSPALVTCPFDGDWAREWSADITYGLWTPLLASSTGDPTAQPPLFRFGCTRVAKIVTQDTDGNPITNTAGDPFNPPLELDSTSVMLVVNRNESRPDFFGIFGGWVDHINQAAWNGFPARTLKICPVNLPERKYSQISGKLYYPMEYQIEFNPDTWDKIVLNQGFRELDPADSSGATLRDILVEGAQVNEPALLDKNGHYLPPPINQKDAVYLTFKVYADLDFSVLGLDNLFANSNAPDGAIVPGFNLLGLGGLNDASASLAGSFQ